MTDDTEHHLARPRTPGALRAWLRDALDLRVPDRALIPGHAVPFEYLCHAFFESPTEEHATNQPDIRDCVVWANRGGGKTFLAAVATLLDLLFKPGIEIRVLAGSLEQAGRMHTHLTNLLERPAFEHLVHGKIRARGARLVNGSGVELLAQSQASVRGTRVQKLRCDEVELFDPRVWEAAQLVTRSAELEGVHVRGAIECLSTMHVPFGLMRTLVREAADGRRRLFRWGVVDVLGACDDRYECATCPLFDPCEGRAKSRDAAGDAPGHLAVDDALVQQSRVAHQTWRSEMLCLEPRRSDCVFPEFHRDTHVVSSLPPTPGATPLCGMDFGFRAPTVVLWATVDAEGVLWITHERSEAGQVLQTHIDAILGRDQPAPDDPPRQRTAPNGTLSIANTADARPRVPEWVGIDPAGRQRSGQTGVSDAAAMRRAGIRVRDRRIGLQHGLAMLRARLAPASGPPRLYVHERCTTLIESLETYHYPADDPESIAPVKDGADHAVDALRYLVQNLDTNHQTRLGSY